MTFQGYFFLRRRHNSHITIFTPKPTDSLDSVQNFGFEAKYYFCVNSYHISARKESIPYQSSFIMLKFQQNRTKPEVIRFYLLYLAQVLEQTQEGR